MDSRFAPYGNILLVIGGCLLFALGWLLGGGMAISRGEPARAESKATVAELAKLKKQIQNLQSQQSQLSDKLDEARTSRRSIRKLTEDLEALQGEVSKLRRETLKNPLTSPAGALKNLADALANPSAPTPSPSPSPIPE
jgi:chromosome segregation ATPase